MALSFLRSKGFWSDVRPCGGIDGVLKQHKLRNGVTSQELHTKEMGIRLDGQVTLL